MRNTLAREVAAEVRRCTGRTLSRPDKRNREDRVASICTAALVASAATIDGERIVNVRFTRGGFTVDLGSGGTIAVRITAKA